MSIPNKDRVRWDREAAELDREIEQTRRLQELSRPLEDFEARPIEWLWPNRIARGKLTMLAGDPKLGKSLVTADLAARISAGLLWPDRSGEAPLGSVIFASAEDDPADTIRPRIEAAGGDVSRIHIIDAVSALDDHGELYERPFNLKHDGHRLEIEIGRLRDVLAVVIDPVTAYLGGTDSHKNAEVRELLAPLSRIASEHKVAVLAVSHLNKSSGTNALYRVSGSLAFTAAARTCWLVAKDQDDGDRRLMLPSGSNIAPDIGGLAYRIVPVEMSVGAVPRLEWEPEPVTVDAAEALAPDSDERDERNEIVDWLREILADGPVKVADLRKRAHADGFAWRTVQRSRKQAGVESVRSGFGQGARWRIRATEGPPIEPGTNGTNGANEQQQSSQHANKVESRQLRQYQDTGADESEVIEL